MKKSILLLFCGVLLFGFACKKDENETPKTVVEKIMESVVQSATVVDSIRTMAGGPFEFGHKLFFSRNGHITALGCRFPITGKAYTVNLWDFDSKALLSSATVVPTDFTTFTYAAVTPVAVTANTKYLISANNYVEGAAQPFFLGINKTGGQSLYPFTEGSATFEGVYYVKSNVAVFPGNLNPSQEIIAGIADCIFEYTE